MSATRETIADILELLPEKVCCGECQYAKKFINEAYTCEFWPHGGITKREDFCSFFCVRGET